MLSRAGARALRVTTGSLPRRSMGTATLATFKTPSVLNEPNVSERGNKVHDGRNSLRAN